MANEEPIFGAYRRRKQRQKRGKRRNNAAAAIIPPFLPELCGKLYVMEDEKAAALVLERFSGTESVFERYAASALEQEQNTALVSVKESLTGTATSCTCP